MKWIAVLLWNGLLTTQLLVPFLSTLLMCNQNFLAWKFISYDQVIVWCVIFIWISVVDVIPKKYWLYCALSDLVAISYCWLIPNRVLRLYSKLDWLYWDSVMMIWLVFCIFCHFHLKPYLKQNVEKYWIANRQVKLPFEKLLHSLRNFPEEATDPDVLLPLAFSFKVIHFLLCKTCVYMSACFWINVLLHVSYSCVSFNFPVIAKTKSWPVLFSETISICCLLALGYNVLSPFYSKIRELISMV